MWAETRKVQSDFCGVVLHDSMINGIRRQALPKLPRSRILDRAEEGAVRVLPVTGSFKVIIDPLKCSRVGWDKANLPPLP
jgi:hypothetical protein